MSEAVVGKDPLKFGEGGVNVATYDSDANGVWAGSEH